MSIKTKVTGVSFENRQSTICMLEPGETLFLRDMADERYPEAIGVFTADDEQCGSINAKLAVAIREQYDDFESLNVIVVQITGGEDYNFFGCNIEIYEDGDVKHYTPPVQRANPLTHSQPTRPKTSTHNRTVAIILCVLFGYLGIHRFYLGKKGTGFLYLCTVGLMGIGWAYDLVSLILHRLKDSSGKYVA